MHPQSTIAEDTRQEIDYLIIGQGLAGSLLGWILLQQQQSILIVDRHFSGAASAVAAGLINPVTGKRFVKAPGVGDGLQEAAALYARLERFFDTRLLYPHRMIRLFRTSQERDSATRRLCNPEYRKYLSAYTGEPVHPWNPLDELGGVSQTGCAHLDIGALLESTKRYFLKRRVLVIGEFDWNDLNAGNDRWHWRNYQVRNIISCEGFRSMLNPYFNWLPFQPSAGEIITAHSPQQVPDVIVNRGHWLLPTGEHRFRIGATYRHELNGAEPVIQAGHTLAGSVSEIFRTPPAFRVVELQSGIRPGTLDKAPFLGRHPSHRSLYSFNGFGSRGALNIPIFARAMVDFLLHSRPLPEEVDIKRYYSHHATG